MNQKSLFLKSQAFLSAFFLCTGLISARAHAEYEHLTIALSTDVTTLDPHQFNMDTNNAIAEHVFDRLITKGADESLKPGLAISWKNVGPRVWMFELRKGVRFQDGTRFTAKDVECSYRRAVRMAWKQHLGPIQSMQAIGDSELQIETDRPRPTLPNSLALVPIISCKQENATTADFDSGRAMNGTGPFQFVRRIPGKLIEYKRNPKYWGKAAPWRHLVFKIIRDPGSRVAALKSGKVDVIANVPGEAASALRAKGFQIFSRLSNRLIFLHLDTHREFAEYVHGLDGAKVANPFRLKKVREAFMIGIDRATLVKEELGGMARATGQLVPEGTPGYSPKLPVPKYDPAKARRLLAEAAGEGPEYAYLKRGFRLVIDGPNDRYINDGAVLKKVARMLGTLGIQASAEAMPQKQFFPLAGAPHYGFTVCLAGWASDTGEAGISLETLLTTVNLHPGWGIANRGRYSNAEVDALTEQADSELQPSKRDHLLRRAVETAMNDAAIIPLYFQKNAWGARPGLRLEPRVDEHTQAFDIWEK